MSHSRRVLAQVLMYHTREDRAFWVTPAKSWLLLCHDPYLERVEEDDFNYTAVAMIAGPKPQIYIESTEDYDEPSGSE